MNFPSAQLIEERRRELMREAERHRLAREAREAKRDGMDDEVRITFRLPADLLPEPQPERKPVRRPA